MHQTSSRLLRMTDDDRPFTKVRRVVLPNLVWCALRRRFTSCAHTRSLCAIAYS
jgi:hypothetical protein